jgi:hypothetical protein
MDAQLHLLPESPVDEPAPRTEWRLDESTRSVGRQGIAQARAALRSAIRSQRDERPEHDRRQASAA